MTARRKIAHWLLRNEVPRRVKAVHVRDLIQNELASTDDSAVETALYRLLDQVWKLERTP